MNKSQDIDVLFDYFMSHTAQPQGQRGNGVGCFLGGIFRTVLPLLKNNCVSFQFNKRKPIEDIQPQEKRRKITSKPKVTKKKKTKKSYKKEKPTKKTKHSSKSSAKKKTSKRKVYKDIFSDGVH